LIPGTTPPIDTIAALTYWGLKYIWDLGPALNHFLTNEFIWADLISGVFKTKLKGSTKAFGSKNGSSLVNFDLYATIGLGISYTLSKPKSTIMLSTLSI
jgi:hypothetical protein